LNFGGLQSLEVRHWGWGWGGGCQKQRKICQTFLFGFHSIAKKIEG